MATSWKDLLAVMEEHGVNKVGDLPKEIVDKFHSELFPSEIEEEDND